MSSSKAKDNQTTETKAADRHPSRPSRRRTVVAWVVFIGAAAAIGVGAVVVRAKLTDEEYVIDEARSRLLAAANDPSPAEAATFAQYAGEVLPGYLDNGGQQADSARLFLCTALAVREALNGNLAAADRKKLANLLDEIELANCATTDLLAAGKVLILAQQFPVAERVVLDGLAKRPEKRKESLYLAAELFRQQHRYGELLRYCNELTELAPNDPGPWLVIAEAYERRGLELQLRRVYPKIIELLPEQAPEYRRRLLRVLVSIGEVEAARSLFDSLREESPALLRSDPFIEANLLHVEGRVDEAHEQLQDILADDPMNAEAAVLLSRILMSREEPAEVRALLEPLVKTESHNKKLHYLLGQAHIALDNKELGYKHLSLHREITIAGLKIDAIEKQLKEAPNNLTLIEQLPDLYALIGDYESARHWARVAERIRASRAG